MKLNGGHHRANQWPSQQSVRAVLAYFAFRASGNSPRLYEKFNYARWTSRKGASMKQVPVSRHKFSLTPQHPVWIR